MDKRPTEQKPRRQGDTAEPFRRAVIFFTPFRLAQVLGFVLIFAICVTFTRGTFLQQVDNYFYSVFLNYQESLQTAPTLVYIGMDEKSVADLKAFPWPKSYYITLTRALKEWGAKSIVFNSFFTQGSDSPHENMTLAEEFQKANNVFLPVSFETEGFKNYYYVNQSDPLFSEVAKGVGYINFEQDRDNVIRRFRPLMKFNQKLMPHLGVLVAYNYLGKPIPTFAKQAFMMGDYTNLFIRWRRPWDQGAKYYSFSDVLASYDLIAKGQPSPINPSEFKDKICLVGMSGFEDMLTPLRQKSPAVGVLGNIINTVLSGQYVRLFSPARNAFLLLVIAMLAGILCIPYRGLFSWVGAFFLGLGWMLFSFITFSKWGWWFSVSTPFSLILGFLFLSLLLDKIEDYQDKRFLLSFALRDELTGLYVMRYMKDFLAQAMNYSKVFGQPFGVILFDLDDFKNVNDLYGYPIGNNVLKRVAEVIQNSTRMKGRALPDIVGRYGDEEFIVLLIGDNLSTATFGIAERIRMAIEAVTFKVENKSFSITVSAGVSILTSGEKNPNKVVERAQEALLRAKANGKNQTCISND